MGLHSEKTEESQMTSSIADTEFASALRQAKGYVVEHMEEDGNCLFRAVAHQVWADPERHDLVREQTLNYMDRNRDHFAQFVSGDFDAYVRRKRQLRVYGDHAEIQAMSEIYNRPIEVYSEDVVPLNIFQGRTASSNAPIRLSYHGGNHYNSIIDPASPAFGVGLGITDLDNPGEGDKKLLDRTRQESEREAVEQDLYSAAVL